MKADWGSGGTVQRILELGTTPRERAPVIHWIGSWVGPRAVLDTVSKRKVISLKNKKNLLLLLLLLLLPNRG
jgi:hypothetical protein